MERYADPKFSHSAPAGLPDSINEPDLELSFKDVGLVSELLGGIDQIEQDKGDYRDLQEALRELESRYQSLVENIPDVIYSLDRIGNILTINKAVVEYGFSPDELIGKVFTDLIHPEDRRRVITVYLNVLSAGKSYARTRPFRILSKCGEVHWFEANFFIRCDNEGRFIRQEGVCRDITDSVHYHTSLMQAREALEEQVRKRTHELLETNKDLQKEIEERRATENALREREAELEKEKANLQAANTALRVLLKRREVDKKELEEQVLYNLKKLVMPYLDKLQKEFTDETLSAYLAIIESNLKDITSGFSRRLSLEFCGLSQAELKIANFIRQGKKSREISKLLNLSVRTVEAARQNIRRKLHLDHREMNLRTFLMSIR